MESLYKGHIGTVLYIEVVLYSEVIVQWNLSIGTLEIGKCSVEQDKCLILNDCLISSSIEPLKDSLK